MNTKNSKIKRASLNHTYRLVWSDAKQMFIAVAEIAPGKGKRKGGIVGAVAALMMGFGGVAHALDPGTLPTGGNVTHGNATISQSGNVMNIHQSSDRIITNWNTFNIGENATVNFHQPSSSSAALNRIQDNNPSQILGNLNANGQVYLINPNGILFGQNAQVDVGGLIASTLEISDQDFLNNTLNFKNLGLSDGQIKNLGTIRAKGGVVALIANQVTNQGTIHADHGNVALAAGNQVTLDFTGDGLMTVTVEQGVIDALAQNGGLIQADGGFVIMTTQAQNDIYKNVVNNTGIIQAQTLENKDGKIMLMGGMTQGQTIAGGTLDASAPNGGDGGFIETSAAKVDIQPGLVVTTKAENGKTGEWLIDPTDFTISAGTSAQTASGIGATTLQNNLVNTSVEIQTVAAGSEQGNIHVDADVQWAENKLTLTAHGDILINSTLTAAGSAELALNHGWNGNAASPTYGNNNSHLIVHGRVDLSETSANNLAINGQNHTILRSQSEVAGISSDLNGRYVLGGNLDLSGNWAPIGTFTGSFDGLGNQIHGLVVNHNASGAGLFGNTNGATLSNLRLVGVNVTNSGGGVGALVGNAVSTQITNVHASGAVTSTRAVDAAADAGGLVGYQVGGMISFSSAEVEVTANGRNVGGLVGDATSSAKIVNSFALGNVEILGNQGNVGGLVGALRNTSSISNSYATGNVAGRLNNAGNTGIGGLIGEIRDTDATVTNSYSTGSVTTTGTGDLKGGLVGANLQGDGLNVTNSYWVNGLDSSAGGTRVTTNENNLATYTGFGDSWTSLEGYATPFLKAQGSDALMLNRDLVIESVNDLALNQNFNSVSVLGEATLTLKAQRDVVFVPGRTVNSSGGQLNLVLWADSDGNDSGGILFDTGSSITTNGGHLWMGGGSDSTSWNGLTVGNSYAANLNTSIADSTVNDTYAGINVIGTTLDAGSGDLYMSGKSFQTTYRFGVGTRFNGGNNITANNISIHGIGSANAATSGDTNRGNWGVGIENTIMSATGDIHINGQGGGQGAGSDGGQNHGIRMDANSHLTASGAGNITLIGIGGGNTSITANTDNDGIRLDGGRLTTASGAITLQGKAGLHGSSEGVSLNSGDVNNLIQSTEGGDITVIADTLVVSSNQRLSSSGNLVIKPENDATAIGLGGADGTLSLASSYFNTNFVNGFSNIIIGSETAGNIAVGGTTTYRDNLTLKAAGDITMNASSNLTGAAGENASLVFWADADNSGAGSIQLMDGSVITTNSGHLWMGGGSGSATWNGLTVGDGYAMAGTTHHVFTDANRELKNGITFSDATLTTAGGDVALYGKSLNQTATGMQGYVGILFSKSEIDSGNGDIHISAIQEGSSINASWNYGLLMITRQNNLTSSIASTGGNITIIGETSFAKNTHGAGVGLYGWNNPDSLLSIQSVSGDIHVTGKLNSTGFDEQYGGIYFFGESQENIVSQSGNIYLNGFSANPNVAGINVHPGNTTSSIGFDGTNAFTGDITLNSNTFINFEGAITANTLNLLGSGVNYTLQNVQNNVNALTANTGSVSFVNSGALELRDITTSGKIDIATQTGDLTIAGNIAAGSTDSDAIILNAGKSEAAGTASGGNIIHQSGSITTGADGRALLYTGSVAGSTGVAELVGIGSGHFRYNSSEGNHNFTKALGDSGIFAIYREQPVVTVTANNDSKVSDGVPYSGGNGVTFTGFVNGDTLEQALLIDSLNYSGSSQGASNEGTYTISPEGLVDLVGYGLVNADGELTITAATAPEPAPEPTPEPTPAPTEPVRDNPVSPPAVGEGNNNSPATSLKINDNAGTTLLAGLNTNALVIDQRPAQAQSPVLAVQPPGLVIAGERVPVNFVVVGNTTTLDLGEASPRTEEVSLEGLPIFASRASGELLLDSLVTVQDRGNSLSASRSDAQNANISAPSLANAVITERTQAEVQFDNGQTGQIEVSMTEDGTLIIEIPQDAVLSDENQVTLLGVAAAKRAGVATERLRSIVVQRK